MNATYSTAVAYGEFKLYRCCRVLNNRGEMGVWRLGSLLWRSDNKKRVTAKDLRADGWVKVGRVSK